MESMEFFKRLKGGSLPRCLLLHGEEEYVKDSAVAQLRAAILPQGLEVMNEAVLQGTAQQGEIIEACEQLPFMGEGRLVLVWDHPLVLRGGGSADGDDLIQYLPDLPEWTTLAFVVRGGADARRKLSAAIGKMGGIVVFRTLQEGEIASFLRRECQRAGKELQAQAARRLVFLCGKDLTALSREIEKAIAHAGERREVTVRDIDAVAVPSLEANVFQMMDALLEGRGARAQGLYRALLRDGESPIMMLAVLTRNLRQVRHARALLDAGLPRAQIAKAVGVSGYVADKVIGRAGTIRAQWLEEMQSACERADYEIKSGANREDIALDIALLAMMDSTKKRQPQ